MNRLVVILFVTAWLLMSAVGPVFASGPVTVSACDASYIVKFGDTLGSIAQICGVTLEEIIAENPAITDPNLVVVGQQLQIPGKPSQNQAPLAQQPAARQLLEQQPPTAASVDERLDGQQEDQQPSTRQQSRPGSVVADREEGERIISPHPTRSTRSTAAEEDQAVGIPVTGSSAAADVEKTYQVKGGDSLGRIAAQEGVTINQIMFVNPDLLNPNVIYPGQTLNIPPSNLDVPEDAWKNLRIQQAVSIQEQIVRNFSPAEGERWIYVDLATQTVHAYEGSQIVRSFLVSTGRPQTPTVTGHFKIWTKMKTDDMSGPGYDLKDVPFVMYFYKGYGLHGTYWHNNFGSTMSHGCVNLSTPDAEWLYNFASVGTVVKVQ